MWLGDIKAYLWVVIDFEYITKTNTVTFGFEVGFVRIRQAFKCQVEQLETVPHYIGNVFSSNFEFQRRDGRYSALPTLWLGDVSLK